MEKTIKILAPAKINLYLKVLNKRDDAYHNIQSVFMPVHNLNDELQITTITKNKLIVTSNSSSVPDGEGNLCYKAALLFANTLAIEPRWHIQIKKNIPVEAGLGGGSSDAAAVLKSLNTKFFLKKKKPLSGKKLLLLAAKLGADVPFFINSKVSRAEGIGEILTPIKTDFNMPVLILNPRFPVSSKWAYSNCLTNKQCTDTSFKEILSALENNRIDTVLKLIYNSFEEALFKKFTIFSLLSKELIKNNAKTVNISGSGPSLFSFFTSKEKLKRTEAHIKDKYENSIWTHSCFNLGKIIS